MNIKRILSIIIILALGILAGYWFGRSSHPGEGQGTGMQAPEGAAPSKERKVKYWQAPMDPTYIRDKPGKSPMGMDLIPVYEEEEPVSEPGAIRIDPVTVQNIGVRTARVEKRPLSKEIRTVGRVDYNEKRVEHIHTKIEGWVERLFVDFTGEEVRRGAPLLSIYSPELVSTQEEYLLALKYKRSLGKSPFASVSEGADSLLTSTRKRLELFDITPRQIDEIEKKGVVQKNLTLHSPTHGVVIEKMVQEGMYVKPGKNLYTIADISDVWVYADIYEYELPWLSVGQDAEMTLSYLPGKSFHGKIIYIYPFLDKKTRTVKVRMEFENPDWELKPDMYVNVKVRSRVAESTLVLPAEAVLRSGDKDVVVLAMEGGKFLPRPIRLGAEGEGVYQVLAGLSEGDRVVTSAQFLIDSESKLKEAISKMLEAQKAKGETGEGADKGGQETAPMEMSVKMEKLPPVTEEVRGKMDRVLDQYLVIQKKLQGDSIEGVQPLAVEIATLAEQVKKLDKEHTLHEITAGITASAPALLRGDIDEVREGFKKLSEALSDYVKRADPQGSKARGMKIFFCPMVKEPWIQKGDKVENPYFGKKMLTCGNEVKY